MEHSDLSNGKKQLLVISFKPRITIERVISAVASWSLASPRVSAPFILGAPQEDMSHCLMGFFTIGGQPARDSPIIAQSAAKLSAPRSTNCWSGKNIAIGDHVPLYSFYSLSDQAVYCLHT